MIILIILYGISILALIIVGIAFGVTAKRSKPEQTATPRRSFSIGAIKMGGLTLLVASSFSAFLSLNGVTFVTMIQHLQHVLIITAYLAIFWMPAYALSFWGTKRETA